MKMISTESIFHCLIGLKVFAAVAIFGSKMPPDMIRGYIRNCINDTEANSYTETF